MPRPFKSIVDQLFDFLRACPESFANSADAKPDLIFVLAGREERKSFGLDLYNKGIAGEILLSVGRFEWRRFYELGLPDDGGLRGLIEKTPPSKRHFFVSVGSEGTRSWRVERTRFGTFREIDALARLLERRREVGEEIRRVLIISTSVHLRRTALVFRRRFRGLPFESRFLAIPESRSSLRRADWFRHREGRAMVLGELLKYAVYVLNLPGLFLSRRFRPARNDHAQFQSSLHPDSL